MKKTVKLKMIVPKIISIKNDVPILSYANGEISMDLKLSILQDNINVVVFEMEYTVPNQNGVTVIKIAADSTYEIVEDKKLFYQPTSEFVDVLSNMASHSASHLFGILSGVVLVQKIPTEGLFQLTTPMIFREVILEKLREINN